MKKRRESSSIVIRPKQDVIAKPFLGSNNEIAKTKIESMSFPAVGNAAAGSAIINVLKEALKRKGIIET